ncbi:MAG: hypothetical protein HEQ39_13525 [Rhizobacter sp.]
MLLFFAGCSTSTQPNPELAEQVGASTAQTESSSVPRVGTVKRPLAPSPASFQILSWDEAIQTVAADLQGAFAASGETPAPWVAEPFIDGLTGAQSAATRYMTDRVSAWWRAQVPLADPWPFTPQSVSKARWWLMGSITPAEVNRQQQAPSPTWRLCIALADVQSGVVIAKAIAFAASRGVPNEPSAFFRDAPVAINDTAAATQDRRCQGLRTGEVLPKSYLARLTASPLINSGIQLYDSGSHAQALRQFELSLQTPAGHQFRTYTGVYLAQVKLRQQQAARQAFRTLIDHGIDQGEFSLSLAYRPGSKVVLNQVGQAPEGDRLLVIAERLSKRLTCAEITAANMHTTTESRQLAAVRAEQVRKKLVQAYPVLDKRLRFADQGLNKTAVHQPKVPPVNTSSELVVIRFQSIDCY